MIQIRTLGDFRILFTGNKLHKALQLRQMLRKETVEEYFVEAPHMDTSGHYLGLPLAGELIYMSAKRTWLREKFPEGQTPMVSSGPKVLPDGTEGFSIRKEIIFKP